MNRNRTIAFVVAASTLAACSINPMEDPTRYYVLSSIPEDADLYAAAGLVGETVDEAAMAAGPPFGHAVGIGPVTLPTYLKRTRMVTRETGNELRLLEADRWGEPLQEAIQSSLAENLALLLRTGEVVLHPWYSTGQPMYSVAVDVVRFERNSGGTATLAAQWEIRDAEGRPLVAADFRQSRPPVDATIAGSVSAQSELLVQMSREIADAIRRAAS